MNKTRLGCSLTCICRNPRSRNCQPSCTTSKMIQQAAWPWAAHLRKADDAAIGAKVSYGSDRKPGRVAA